MFKFLWSVIKVTFWILTISIIAMVAAMVVEATGGIDGKADGREPPKEFGRYLTGKATRVIDGDTVEVEIKQTVVLRLRDCWAPETRTKNLVEKKAGIAAKDLLREAVEGQQVTVFVPDPKPEHIGDEFSFGRLVGDIYYDGYDMAEALIEAKAAYRTKTEVRKAFPEGRYN